jgi:hypothetical protein
MAGADGEHSSVDGDGARWRGWLDRGGCGAGGEGPPGAVVGFGDDDDAVDGDGRVGARQTFQCLQAAGVEVAQPAAGQGDQSCGGDLGTPG